MILTKYIIAHFTEFVISFLKNFRKNIKKQIIQFDVALEKHYLSHITLAVK